MYGVVTNSRLGRLSPEDRRTNIVDVTQKVFFRDGYGGTSMSGIAAELGGSKATLYKYFDTKDALFEAVMLRCCKDLFVDFNASLNSFRSVREYLINAGTKLLMGMLEPTALDISRLVLSEGVRHPEIARIYTASALDPSNEAVARGLAHFEAIGQITCPNTIVAAKQFIGMVRADIHLRAICGFDDRPSAAEIHAHIVDATSFFIAGIKSSGADDAA